MPKGKVLWFPFPCNTCKETITYSLAQHYLTVHPDLTYFTCGYKRCNDSYSTPYALKRHLVKVHGIDGLEKEKREAAETPMVYESSAECESESECESETVSESEETPIEEEIETPAYKNESTPLKLLGELLSEQHLSIKHAFQIIKNVGEMYTPMFASLELLAEKLPTDEKKELKAIIKNYENPFGDIDSEYLLLKTLKNREVYVEPVDHVIATEHFTTPTGSEEISIKSSYASLSETLRTFLSLPGMLPVIKSHMQNRPGVIESFIDGKLWSSTISKFQEKNKNGLLIPLMHYYDDFETGNPLGSKVGVNKFGGNYTVVLGLPPKYNSALENFLLCEIFRSSQRTTYSNAEIFKVMVGQYKALASTGIEVMGERVYPLLMLCSGSLNRIVLLLNFILCPQPHPAPHLKVVNLFVKLTMCEVVNLTNKFTTSCLILFIVILTKMKL